MLPTPAHWRQGEDEIAKRVRDDLAGRSIPITPAVEDQIARYAQAETEARRLTEEARQYDPASQESRRLLAAAERSRRNASTEMNRLRRLGRRKGDQDNRPSLLALVKEDRAKRRAEPDYREAAEVETVRSARWSAAHALTGRPPTSDEAAEGTIAAAGQEGEDLAATMTAEALGSLHAAWERS